MSARADYTRKEIKIALDTWKAVDQKLMKRSQAVRALALQNIGEGSAAIFIDGFRKLRRGETYKMALSNDAVELFLEWAVESADLSIVRSALTAFNGNINYYETVEEKRRGVRPTLHSARSLLAKYTQIAETLDSTSKRSRAPDFSVNHEQALVELGAINPGRHWSAFDVPMENARRGDATLLITSIWNHHSTTDDQGQTVSAGIAIFEDFESRSLWYPVPRIRLHSGSSGHRVAHLNRLELAIESRIPIVGVLKDFRTSLFALSHVFDCVPTIDSADNDTIWLQLKPRNDVRPPETQLFAAQTEVFGRNVELGSNIGRETEISQNDLTTLQAEFQRRVEKSLRDSDSARAARLHRANKMPKKMLVTIEVFDRNPDVVAAVLARANGRCEKCGSEAPFYRRKDSSPYLEVHHITRLADNGEDSIDNAQALCPNCHRESHYG
jgi:5-methylcytosine-specific restriction endonuclease McrA